MSNLDPGRRYKQKRPKNDAKTTPNDPKKNDAKTNVWYRLINSQSYSNKDIEKFNESTHTHTNIRIIKNNILQEQNNYFCFF